jgi:hypothetical protein
MSKVTVEALVQAKVSSRNRVQHHKGNDYPELLPKSMLLVPPRALNILVIASKLCQGVSQDGRTNDATRHISNLNITTHPDWLSLLLSTLLIVHDHS